MERLVTLSDAVKIWGVPLKEIKKALPDIPHVLLGEKVMVPHSRPSLFDKEPEGEPRVRRKYKAERKPYTQGKVQYPFTCPSGWIAGNQMRPCLYCRTLFKPAKSSNGKWSKCCCKSHGMKLSVFLGLKKGVENHCFCCGKTKPISEFEPTRHVWCQSCHELYGAR